MSISDVAIKRPVFVTMVAVGAVVMGGLAMTRLGLDLFPDTSFPLVAVTTIYPGASPSEVEQSVTDKLEEAVMSLNGIDRVRSYSRNSVSVLFIEFAFDKDEQEASTAVTEKVNATLESLPKEVHKPLIQRVDPTALPIITYAARSNRAANTLRDFLDKNVRPALEKVDGVAAVAIVGGSDAEVHVDLKRDALERNYITAMQVAQLIGGESIDVPSGHIEDTAAGREAGIKAQGRFQSIEELADMVLRPLKGGGTLRVRDIADVSLGASDNRTTARVNGVPSITFSIQKRGGANTVEVVDKVAATLAKIQIPADIKIEKIVDSSRFIRTNIDHLWEHLILGGLMAILVIFLFMLDWRSTLISGLALPVSIIATFFVMWQFGFTLNIMSMLGLTLSIGILIDDSVVVRENIFRHMEEGADAMTAAREGTKEIALAVLATTLTIVAVFMPVAFTSGMVGSFFKEFGITVSAAVLISMLVSLTLDPMLSARVAKPIEPDHHAKMRAKPVIGWIVRMYDGMDHVYESILRWTLRHKFLTFGAAMGAFFGSGQLTNFMGQEFVARGDRGEFTMQLEMPAGTSLAKTSEVVGRVEAMLKSFPDHVQTATTIGPSGEVEKATLRVQMTKADERPHSIGSIMEDVRGRLRDFPGLAYYLREAGLGDGAMEEAPITMFIKGPDEATLAMVAAKIVASVRATPGVRDATTSYRAGALEERISTDRKRAMDRGAAHQEIAIALRLALDGQELTKIPHGDTDLPVRMRLDASDRVDLAALLRLQVSSWKGGFVRLSEVTEVADAATPSMIERINRGRQITLTGNVYDRDLGGVIKDIEARLGKLELPTGYSYAFGGEAERMKETFDNLGLAMLLAVLFIYLVLASQFESFIHPLTIMFALPMAAIGALVALFVAKQNLGMASFIGIILLMGLVTKNSILLVDYTNQLRAKGMGIVEALLVAGPTRLRPILMTSAAIVLGMLPAALGRGEGSEFQAPMAIAVIGGVIMSTLLTLVVVPIIYIWLDRLTLRGRRERKAAKAAARALKVSNEPA